ncbi:hypothetical protein QFC21_002590 [Naganishia friedmannii]|uniref:Uncharacterized protein n=1 Tax=Naganishia friedmannii TaxID=89922 RepID=A0ACC2VVF3_9TREE|nr:hypothetical protein QFC21_002590 [Naganishia friedmannii]
MHRRYPPPRQKRRVDVIRAVSQNELNIIQRYQFLTRRFRERAEKGNQVFFELSSDGVPSSEWEDSELDEPAQSPLDKVHQLAVYVHSSPIRREEFEWVRAAKNPRTPSGLLPSKGVKTRWNSKEAAIARVIRLRNTVTAFTTPSPGTKCPRFSKKDFDALEII